MIPIFYGELGSYIGVFTGEPVYRAQAFRIPLIPKIGGGKYWGSPSAYDEPVYRERSPVSVELHWMPIQTTWGRLSGSRTVQTAVWTSLEDWWKMVDADYTLDNFRIEVHPARIRNYPTGDNPR